MSDEETPSVEEIKERLKVDIPVEEEATKPKAEAKITSELKSLGRQFAETLETAWHSEERLRAEAEVREGLKSFVDEVDKVIREVKSAPATEKVKEEAAQVKERMESREISRKARTSIVQGLNWLSEELGRLADQFTPVEESAEEGVEGTEEATE